MRKIKALSFAFMRRDRGILEIFARDRKKNISSMEDIILRLRVDMHGRARWHCTHDVTSQLDRPHWNLTWPRVEQDVVALQRLTAVRSYATRLQAAGSRR